MSGVPVVSMQTIEEVARKIVDRFDPDKIILFGSYGRGNPGPYSDVDLLVILPFEGSTIDKSVEILNYINVRFAIDLLARQPEDIAWRYRAGDPLVRDALRDGKLLYERAQRAN